MARQLILEGAEVRSADDLHRALADVLELFDGYGRNWDALWDVLEDDDLRGVKGPVELVWRDAVLYAERDPHGYQIVQKLFEDASGMSLRIA